MTRFKPQQTIVGYRPCRPLSKSATKTTNASRGANWLIESRSTTSSRGFSTRLPTKSDRRAKLRAKHELWQGSKVFCHCAGRAIRLSDSRRSALAAVFGRCRDDDQQTVQSWNQAARPADVSRSDDHRLITAKDGRAPRAGTSLNGAIPATSAGTSSTAAVRRAAAWGWTDE